jgi:hypothetical protein
MLAPLTEGLCQRMQRLPAVLGGTRSGNRASRLRAPAYEHPQRYLILGDPATTHSTAARLRQAATERRGGGFGDGGANQELSRDRLGQG